MLNMGMWEEAVRQVQRPLSRRERERLEYLMQMQDERAEARRSARAATRSRRSGGWLRRTNDQARRPERGSGAAA